GRVERGRRRWWGAGRCWKKGGSPSPATSRRWPATASTANSVAAPTCHARRRLEPAGEGERTTVESRAEVEHRRVADNHAEEVAAERRHDGGDGVDAPSPGNEGLRALRHAGEAGRKRNAHREAGETDERDGDGEADRQRCPEELVEERPEER